MPSLREDTNSGMCKGIFIYLNPSLACSVLANSVDPDQLASEAICTVIKYVNFYQKTWNKYFDWLEIRSRHGICIYSAREGLSIEIP